MARDICDMNGFEPIGKVCLSYGREKTFTLDMLDNHILTTRVKNQLSVRAITRNYPTKYVALVHSFPRLH